MLVMWMWCVKEWGCEEQCANLHVRTCRCMMQHHGPLWVRNILEPAWCKVNHMGTRCQWDQMQTGGPLLSPLLLPLVCSAQMNMLCSSPSFALLAVDGAAAASILETSAISQARNLCEKYEYGKHVWLRTNFSWLWRYQHHPGNTDKRGSKRRHPY